LSRKLPKEFNARKYSNLLITYNQPCLGLSPRATSNCGRPSSARPAPTTPPNTSVPPPPPRPKNIQKERHEDRTHRCGNNQQIRPQTTMQPLPTPHPPLQTTPLRHLPPRQRQLQTLRVPLPPPSARIVHYLLSRDITVFTFDFAGCGLSQGDYISLGYYERGDVDCAFRYLR
jgi:hypothetical protein